MKLFYTPGRLIAFYIFLLLMFAGGSSAQERTLVAHPNIHIDRLIDAYYESLPGDYASTTDKYPLIVFFHGLSQEGDGNLTDMNKVLGYSLPKFIKDKTFPEFVTVNSQNFKFIVVMPQFNVAAVGNYPASWRESAVKSMIDTAIRRYRVDTTRMYLMGISMGGGFVIEGAGNTLATAKRLAGIVPISAGTNNPFISSVADNIAAADLPMMAIGSPSDGWYALSQQYVTAINSPAPPEVPAQLIPAGNSHDLWVYPPYNTPEYEFIPGKSIYQWMLSQQRVGEVLPVVLKNYNVTTENSVNKKAIITWSTSFEQNNAFFTIERSTDGISFVAIAKVQAAVQGKGNSYEYADNSPLDGTSYYRLTQTDKDGSVKKFSIFPVSFGAVAAGLKIYPNPVSDLLVLELNNNVRGKLSVNIIAPDGKILSATTYQKPDAFLRKTIPVKLLGKGHYTLKITGNNYISTQRFVKE